MFNIKDGIYYRIDPQFPCPGAPCVSESSICGAFMAGCYGPDIEIKVVE